MGPVATELAASQLVNMLRVPEMHPEVPLTALVHIGAGPAEFTSPQLLELLLQLEDLPAVENLLRRSWPKHLETQEWIQKCA